MRLVGFQTIKKLSKERIKAFWWNLFHAWSRVIRLKYVVSGFILFVSIITPSCTKTSVWGFDELEYADNEFLDVNSVVLHRYRDWNTESPINISQFGPLGFSHQSAAVYGDYALFVANGRARMCLYSLKRKEQIYTLVLKREDEGVYHCNQSSFGVEKFDSSDFFPLLYISQRAKSDGRCFIEAFRIIPFFNEGKTEFESFTIELVQTIFLPKMSYENSLGNANCAVDASTKMMYFYSRNNNAKEDNFGQCKITAFAIPSIHEDLVFLEDEDIRSSFMIDVSAFNMQGGCIKDGILYIGQGYSSVGYILLNIIDLERRILVKRIDLQAYHVHWEPQGCFFYGGCVMLAHTSAICKIEK